MTSGVPSHGFDCRTRTYRTHCWICDEWVFYFECNHGSRLLFDDLGEPWPIHDHRGLSFEQKRDIAIRKVGEEKTEHFIANEMMAVTEGVRVDAGYRSHIVSAHRQTVEAPHIPPSQIFRQDPYPGASTDETGIVRELIPQVDIHDRFDFPRTGIAAAALGELGERAFAQLTVHTGALGEADSYSYTFLVDRQHLKESSVRREMVVRCGLRGVTVLERDPVWVCDTIELAI